MKPVRWFLIACSLLACLSVSASCASTIPAVPAVNATAQAELPRLANNRAATFRLDYERGHGSGVALTKDGYVLTANHVVDGEPVGPKITVVDAQGKPQTYEGKVIATDKVHDLALVKFPCTFANIVTLADTADLVPGNGIYSVGYPFDFGEVVGRGYISRLHYSPEPDKDDEEAVRIIKDMMLVDIPDGPGTSGCGLYLSQDGAMIGVMRMFIVRGVGRMPVFFIRGVTPINHVRAFLDKNHVAYGKRPSAASAPR